MLQAFIALAHILTPSSSAAGDTHYLHLVRAQGNGGAFITPVVLENNRIAASQSLQKQCNEAHGKLTGTAITLFPTDSSSQVIKIQMCRTSYPAQSSVAINSQQSDVFLIQSFADQGGMWVTDEKIEENRVTAAKRAQSECKSYQGRLVGTAEVIPPTASSMRVVQVQMCQTPRF